MLGWRVHPKMTALDASGANLRKDFDNKKDFSLFPQKKQKIVCLFRKMPYLCGVVIHYVKLKNFRLWKTQDSKKLKIVLNFQDCLVVSNLLCTFAMSNRREKAKAKSQVLYNQQRREEIKPIQKE